MERAPLRPIPSRPPGPVDPAGALAAAREALPELDEPAAAALALVDLAGRDRGHAARSEALAGQDVGAALARARKALRRSNFPLPGSGWCGRAERLISDRLDGELDGPGARRLEVHLRNCQRCVEHERRLVQSLDVLIASLPAAAEERLPEPDGKEAPPSLAVVETEGRAVQPEARVALPGAPPADRAAPQGERVTATEERVGPRRELWSTTGLAWAVLLALAVAIAVATVVVAVLGAVGSSL